MTYENNGFLLIEEPIIDSSTIETLKSQVIPFYSHQAGRAQDLWRVCPFVRDLACNPTILQILRNLYGREPIPFQTLNFIKGTEQRTHSDTIHFSNALDQSLMCGVWVALEDIDLEQGPLHYYEGSHALPIEDYETLAVGDPVDTPNWGDPYMGEVYGKYEEALEKKLIASGCPKKDVVIKAGQAFIWAANLAHGGSPIINKDLTRWSQVTHYYFEGSTPVTNMASLRSKNEFFIREPINIVTGEKMPIVSPSGKGISFRAVPGTNRHYVEIVDDLQFDEQRAVAYLQRYADLQQSIKTPIEAFGHFMRFGRNEGREY